MTQAGGGPTPRNATSATPPGRDREVRRAVGPFAPLFSFLEHAHFSDRPGVRDNRSPR